MTATSNRSSVMFTEGDPFASMASFAKTWHSEPYPEISPERPELSAEGKIVFITGGGSGIGKATAIAFAQAGAKAIAIFGRRRHKLESAAGEIRAASKNSTIVVFEGVDLSERPAVDAAFSSAIDQLGGGKVDVYISNAGIATAKASVSGYVDNNFDTGIDLNFRVPFNAFRAILPYLKPDAKVLNISSGIGHMAPIQTMWLYAATKAAVIKMFDYIQAENPDLHVVNVQPGIVASEINDDLIAAEINLPDAVELPAHFQVWLVAPEARFLKGKFVWVNWNVDELKARAAEIQSSLLLNVGLNGVVM